MDFIPLMAETLEGLTKDTVSTVRSIGRALGQRASPPDPFTSTNHLFGRLAGEAMPALGSIMFPLPLFPSMD